MFSFRFVFMEIFESEKREKCVFYIIFSQKTEHEKKYFLVQKMLTLTSSIYDKIFSFLSCKMTELAKTLFSSEPFFP